MGPPSSEEPNAAAIQAGAVGSSELGGPIQVQSTVAIGPNSGDAVSRQVTCPAGTQVIGGGGFPSSPLSYMVSNTVNANGWFVFFRNTAAVPAGSTITARAHCLP